VIEERIMPTLIACPRCQRKLRVPDDLVGKRVKCPGCEQPFTADAGTAETLALAPQQPTEERVSELPLAHSERDDEPAAELPTRQPARSVPPANWRLVRRGFTLLLASVLTYLGSFLLYMGGTVCVALAIYAVPRAAKGGGPAAMAPAQNMMSAFLVIMGLCVFAWISSFVLWIIGHLMGLAAPHAHGARALAGVTVAMVLGSLVFVLALMVMFVLVGGVSSILANFDLIDGEPVHASPEYDILGEIASFLVCGFMLVAFFTFGFYVRAVGLCLGASGVARSAKGWLITLGVATVLGLLAGGMFYVFEGALDNPRGPGGVGVITLGGLTCLFGIVALVLGIWYIILLAQARTAISSRAPLRI
jgi:hypothetical protein